MIRRILLLVALSSCQRPTVESSKSNTPSSEAAVETPADIPSLPESKRLILVHLSPPRDILLGTTGKEVWAADLSGTEPKVAWRVESPGMLQRAAAGNTGDGLKLYLAYGRGRGQLDVPHHVQVRVCDQLLGRQLHRVWGLVFDCWHPHLLHCSLLVHVDGFEELLLVVHFINLFDFIFY